MNTGRIAALFFVLALALCACGDENAYYQAAPPSQDEPDAGQPLDPCPGDDQMAEEDLMSAPLFIRTPYINAERVNVGGGAAVLETIASNSALATTTLLIESVRYWFTPAPFGGTTLGYVRLALVNPSAEVVYLDQRVVDAQIADAYPEPVQIRLNIALLPGYSIQLLSTAEGVASVLPILCYVVAQGGELG